MNMRITLMGAALACAIAGAGCTVRTVETTDSGTGMRVDGGRVDVDGGTPGEDARVSCMPGEINCSGTCTRVVGDSMNCGSCGNACPAGVTCAIGRCDCMAPMLACDGVCLDPRSDVTHCGDCDTTCEAGEMCTDGVCLLMCDAPNVICSTMAGGEVTRVCTDLQTDAMNCGRCGTVCGAGAECIAGRCQCGTGHLLCGGRCVDVRSDPMNCGSCGAACGEGGVCAGSRCTSCGTGRTDCSGRCVDTMADAFHCGMCGRMCGVGEGCSGGLCECTTGLMDCGSGCVDTMTNGRHCGTCGVDCGMGGVCAAGLCTCAMGLTMCGPSCRNLMRDARNCGMCGRSCAMGEACDTGMCVPATSFRVTSFGTTNCRTMQHDPPSGDDRGGIAVSPSHVFISGDAATVRLSAADLSGLASVGAIHDGLIGDLETEDVYVLMTASGTQPTGTATLTQLGVIDGATGALTAARIALSMPIPVVYGTGVFSGFGEGLIGVPVTGQLQWWRVELPSGVVTRLGNTQNPIHRSCENWAWWGVAEVVDEVHYAAYVESSTRISRLPIPPTGMTVTTTAPTAISTFMNLGDMCSITFSPSRNRWYFHHEYESQFSATPSGEIGGSCDGTFDRP